MSLVDLLYFYALPFVIGCIMLFGILMSAVLLGMWFQGFLDDLGDSGRRLIERVGDVIVYLALGCGVVMVGVAAHWIGKMILGIP